MVDQPAFTRTRCAHPLYASVLHAWPRKAQPVLDRHALDSHAVQQRVGNRHGGVNIGDLAALQDDAEQRRSRLRRGARAGASLGVGCPVQRVHG
jgi:hypothetical protein